jgi:hypothetical protein
MLWDVHFLLDADQLVAKALLDVRSLHGEHRLKGVLLAAENLHLLLVVVELVRDVLDLALTKAGRTSRVCSLPFNEAGLEPKLLPVSFILELYYLRSTNAVRAGS